MCAALPFSRLAKLSAKGTGRNRILPTCNRTMCVKCVLHYFSVDWLMYQLIKSRPCSQGLTFLFPPAWGTPHSVEKSSKLLTFTSPIPCQMSLAASSRSIGIVTFLTSWQIRKRLSQIHFQLLHLISLQKKTTCMNVFTIRSCLKFSVLL